MTDQKTPKPVRAPSSNLEIRVLARKQVKSMMNVLTKIAKDDKVTPSTRVSAAKAVTEFAMLRPQDISDLPDHLIKELMKRVVKLKAESPKDSKKILKQVSEEEQKLN